MKMQRWIAAGTVVAFTLAVIGAGYACWKLLPALWADPVSKSTLMAFLAVFVVVLAILVLGSRLTRRHRP
jgi:hypothetical protein